jgi:GTP-binding protein
VAGAVARFIASSTTPDTLPAAGQPEVAFIGRSNVGKSSLIGLILEHPKLVRTSRTPGRTQTLNLFLFEERIAIVDLPGYGYAKLSKSQRAEMEQMVKSYVQSRKPLAGIVLVVDSRRDPVSPYDAWMAEWLVQLGRPVLVALTKADLVPKNRRLSRAREVERQLGLPPNCSVLCSAKTREGRDEVVRRLSEITGTKA